MDQHFKQRGVVASYMALMKPVAAIGLPDGEFAIEEPQSCSAASDDAFHLYNQLVGVPWS